LRHSPVSGQEVLQALRKKGFSLRRGKGDHIVAYGKPNIAPFPVPLHPELKKGLLEDIIKNSQDFKEDFYEFI
jgi:predicted RNA binding protein YcfA (HicA-like mRNA interferase family)